MLVTLIPSSPPPPCSGAVSGALVLAVPAASSDLQNTSLVAHLRNKQFSFTRDHAHS